MEVAASSGRLAVESLYEEPERAEDIAWPALKLGDVFKIFRSGPVETVALRGIDLEVEAGSFLALLGRSGSGKSTLLALAAGLDQPSAGEVRVAGRSLGLLGEDELAELRAREVAVVFQSDNLWNALSALDNVSVALRIAGVDAVGSRAREALGEVGLSHRLDHRPAELSGGEQQRVAIAAAAARGAPLLLADEPTGELDSTSERAVLDALAAVNEAHGTTIVTATHSERVAAAADTVVEISNGRVAS
jgi:putative ABC transport system ATP-binding protein